MLTTTEIETIVDRIVTHLNPKEVIIFGSYAKGTATIKSDLDICVIQETDLPRSNRVNEVQAVLPNSLFSFDIHVYTPEEIEVYRQEPFSFVASILKTGRTVFRDR